MTLCYVGDFGNKEQIPHHETMSKSWQTSVEKSVSKVSLLKKAIKHTADEDQAQAHASDPNVSLSCSTSASIQFY
ncbi:Signal recognition particle receptor FtsY [Trichinella pseudospiralis]